jgi:hypothetical protein
VPETITAESSGHVIPTPERRGDGGYVAPGVTFVPRRSEVPVPPCRFSCRVCVERDRQ